MKGKNRGFSREKIISAIIVCAVILTLGVGVFAVVKESKSTGDNKNNIVDLNEKAPEDVAIRTEDADLPGENDDALEEDVDGEAVMEQTEAPTEEETQTQEAPSEEQQLEVAAEAQVDPLSKYSFGETDVLVWPVQGDIVLKYSMDSTIFFESLNVYKCNPAISIASDVGTSVAAAASGIVQSVEVNEETGTTVTVAIGDGYETTYGLLDEVTVKAGDSIAAGQYLGTVASPTAYYVKEGSNLYFKLTKDGVPVDPMGFFE